MEGQKQIKNNILCILDELACTDLMEISIMAKKIAEDRLKSYKKLEEKTVYKTKHYTVKRNSEQPTPRYMIYSNEVGEIVKIAKSQVEATMWIKRQ